MKILELVKANYETYRNNATGLQERHRRRILCSLLVACLLAAFSDDTSAAYPIMVTGITILTGFTFTALFSDYVVAEVGLPTASDESDRSELSRLSKLSANFKARSSYFIGLSIIVSALLIAASLKFSIPEILAEILSNFGKFMLLKFGFDYSNLTAVTSAMLSEIFFVIVTFAYLECLYTFFRLSETIIAIVDLRTDYLKAYEDRKKLASIHRECRDF
jgi:hypothetical protein